MKNLKFRVENQTLLLEKETENLTAVGSSKHEDRPIKLVWLSKDEAYVFCPETPEEDFSKVHSQNEKTSVRPIKKELLEILMKTLEDPILNGSEEI